MVDDVGKASAEDKRSWKRIEFRHSIAQWCLRRAKAALVRGQIEDSLRWSSLVAFVAERDCTPLVYPELESVLVQIASLVPTARPWMPVTANNVKRYLHVLSAAHAHGGHTAMVRRWIELDGENGCHSAVLIDQTVPVPERLRAAVEKSGGQIVMLDAKASLLKKVEALRECAYRMADVVILSIWAHDIIPTVAFGIEGGPPVLLVNQAAQIFWVGVAVSDIVLNVRGSDKEIEWTARYRSVGEKRCATLPIPLIENADEVGPGNWMQDRRRAAKTALGLCADCKIVLTVGDSYKYRPIGGVDFLDAALEIVKGNGDVNVLAVGVEEDERWSNIRKKTRGRVRAVGRQMNVTPYHYAADVYIEGFPFGSTTALLEACLNGVPCVLAPSVCPPPFTSDGVALDNLSRPRDVAEYVGKVNDLLLDDRKRIGYASSIQHGVECAHSGEGWLDYLAKVKKKIPLCHKVYSIADPPELPCFYGVFWDSFYSSREEDCLLNVFRKSWDLGLKPALDRKMWQAMSAAKGVRNASRILDVALFVTGLLVGAFPMLENKRFFCHKLYYYLRDEGKIVRCLTRAGMGSFVLVHHELDSVE
jgi:hypothetical protein